jgi:hypothetical protein
LQGLGHHLRRQGLQGQAQAAVRGFWVELALLAQGFWGVLVRQAQAQRQQVQQGLGQQQVQQD